MNVSHLATVVYGALAIVLAFALSFVSGSYWGMTFAALSAGVTYVFQALDVASSEIDPDSKWVPPVMVVLWALVVVLWLASLYAGAF